MKSMLLGLVALGLSAGAAAAQSWEAVSVSETAVMAVDWSTLRINGGTRRVTVAVVASRPTAGAAFDYGTSSLDIDCASPRYITVSSKFFNIDGTRAADDYAGDGSWEAINAGAMLEDVRAEVCASTASRPGFFDNVQVFAVNVRNVVAQE